MKYKYYMHDSKEGAMDDVLRILDKKGEIENPDSYDELYEHPLYETIFMQLFQNEIAIEFDFSKDLKKSKPTKVQINGKWWKLSK